MADTKAFYRLLFELREIEDLKKLQLWYVSLSKPSPYGSKEEWDKLSEKDKKLLLKNINNREKILKKMKKSVLSQKDLNYLAKEQEYEKT